jgi:hypothetical protein
VECGEIKLEYLRRCLPMDRRERYEFCVRSSIDLNEKNRLIDFLKIGTSLAVFSILKSKICQKNKLFEHICS